MSKIQWCDDTWNPIVGCSKVSEGCQFCYASQDSPHRFPKVYDREGVVVIRGTAKKPGLTWVPRDPSGKSLGKGAQWTGELRMLPWALSKPLERRKPTTYFVNSLSDIFHESLVDCEEGRRFIAAIFGVMAACPQHTFQLLTKRPGKAREWFAWAAAWRDRWDSWRDVIIDPLRTGSPSLQAAADVFDGHDNDIRVTEPAWPLANVWIGTSVEGQRAADERIPELLRVPAALRFLSVEPLLGPVDLDPLTCDDCGSHDVSWGDPGSQPWCAECDTEMGSPGWLDDLGWAIVGGESGAKARPCEVAWIRSVVDQCKAADVPVFVKQLGADVRGAWDYPLAPRGARVPLASKKGDDPAEWPEDLRVRQMPE